jgi:A/G-specific adenine glycosylase
MNPASLPTTPLVVPAAAAICDNAPDSCGSCCAKITPARCPLAKCCLAYRRGNQNGLPRKAARKTVPHCEVVAGVIWRGGKILIDRRAENGLLGGLWEFPGGKQEPGEAIEATIVRELREELAIEAAVGEELITLDHAYSHKKLHFVVHLCNWLSGEPQPLASQQVRWVRPAELSDYPFPAANARIIAALLEHLAPAGAA